VQAEGRAAGPAGIAVPLAITFAIQTLVALAVYCSPVMAPVAAPAMGVDPAAIGYFIAITYFGSMIGTAAAGGTVARFGPIRVSQVGLALGCMGLACSASGWLPLALAGALLVGLGYGPATPASSVILVRTAPPSLIAFTFSIKQTGVPAGAALAGALVPGLILWVGWQGAALAIGCAAAMLALAIQPWRERYDAERNPTARISLASALAPIRMVLGTPSLLGIAATGFIFGGVQITLVTYLVIFLTSSFEMSLVLAGFVLAVSQVASVTGRIGWGVMADRVLSRRAMLGVLGLGMGLSSIATLWAGPHWPHWLLFTFAAIFGATAVGWNGVWVAEVARLAPAGKVSEATGGCLFFTFLGVVITPPLFNAMLSAVGSYAIAYAVFGGPALLIGLRLLLTRPA
jgi:MFS family permease